jgi:LysM repeat protein
MKISELLTESRQKDFIDQNYDTAKMVGDQLGVDPKIILGHWALETGWGKSVIPGTNNLGNIKDFSGGGVKAYDNLEKSNDFYRAYKDSGEFASDYARLLSKRFPEVVGSGEDAAAFAKALQSGKYKYATDKSFSKKIQQMPRSVEKFLNLNNKSTSKVSSILDTPKIDAPKSITPKIIAPKFDLTKIDTPAIDLPDIDTANKVKPKKSSVYKGSVTAREIAKINGINNVNQIKVGQQLLLPDGSTHVVKKGDTLDKIGNKIR